MNLFGVAWAAVKAMGTSYLADDGTARECGAARASACADATVPGRFWSESPCTSQQKHSALLTLSAANSDPSLTDQSSHSETQGTQASL